MTGSCVGVLLSVRWFAGHDHEPAARVQHRQRLFLHADVPRELSSSGTIRLERDMPQRRQICVGDIPYGQDGELLVVQQQAITRLHATVLDLGGVQYAEVMQLGWGALTEDDQHALPDEVRDQGTDADDGGGVPDGAAHQTGSMLPVPT